MPKISALAVLVTAVVLLAGCAASGTAVRYRDPNAIETVTAAYGSTDLHSVVDKMVQSLVASRILSDRPVLIVQALRNRTTEHIDTKAIADKIRTELLKAGAAQFSAVDRDELRSEVIDQLEFQSSSLVDPKTGTKYGQIVGARYILQGEITSIVKQGGRKQDYWYKVDMKLVNIETALIEWADDKEFSKEATRRLIGWDNAPLGGRS